MQTRKNVKKTTNSKKNAEKNSVKRLKRENNTDIKAFKDFSKSELAVIKRLSTPQKIQDFLDSIPYNKEIQTETCRSPREVIRRREAHCIEGALFAAACLRYHNLKPLIVDLESVRDHDHVICVFKEKKLWGAISKSKFHSLGYRDPIHKNIRELALTYFPSYHNYRGQKSLRRYSVPVNLKKFDKIKWMTSEKDLWDIGNHLFTVRHEDIYPKGIKLRTVPLDAQYADTARPPKNWSNIKPKKGY